MLFAKKFFISPWLFKIYPNEYAKSLYEDKFVIDIFLKSKTDLFA
jgi:hypothetical protein